MVSGCEVKCLEQSREAFLSGYFFFSLQAIPGKVTQSPDKEKLTLIHMHACMHSIFSDSWVLIGIFYLFYSKKQKKMNHIVTTKLLIANSHLILFLSGDIILKIVDLFCETSRECSFKRHKCHCSIMNNA